MNLKIALSLIGSVALVAAAHAQSDYPNRPIRLIVPFAAGSGSDGVMRIVMPDVSKRLGQPILIENEGGAGGIPGTTRVAKAVPDGYTLLHCNPLTAVVNPLVFKELPYDPVNDFIPVSNTSAQALIMAVPASSPYKSVQDFMAAWKEGKVKNYGSVGPGTSAHLIVERMKSLTGLDLKHIPFPSGPSAPLALGRGEIDMMFYSLAGFQPMVQSGTVRMIGIAMPERSALTPDLPTIREQGYDLVIQAWYGVCAPKGTPKPIVDKLAKAIIDTLADPAVIKKLNGASTDAAPSKSPEEFARFIDEERKLYKDMVEKAGIPKS